MQERNGGRKATDGTALLYILIILNYMDQHDLEALHILENLTQNRLEWRERIHIADPKFFG